MKENEKMSGLKRWVLVVLTLTLPYATHAQTTARPNVLAHFRIRDIKPYEFLASFAPGSPTPIRTHPTSDIHPCDISPDGQWDVCLDRAGLDPVYLKGPGSDEVFSDVQTHWIRSAQFSVDGRYLLYKGFVLSSPGPGPDGYYRLFTDRLLVGIMDLATQKRLEIVLQSGSFPGGTLFQPAERTSEKLFSLEYFHFDGRNLFVYQPDAIAFYRFDLGSLSFADFSAVSPAPQATRVFDEPPENLFPPSPTPSQPPTAVPTPDAAQPPLTATAPFAMIQKASFQLSPDGAQLVLWISELRTVPTAGQEEDVVTDRLVVCDLASARCPFDQSLDQGDTIQSVTWKPDGSEILFITSGGGSLYTLNPADQTLVRGPSLNPEGTAQAEEILACGDHLFLVGVSASGSRALYSTPLDDLAARSGPLDDLDLSPRGGVESIHLVKCLTTPPPGANY